MTEPRSTPPVPEPAGVPDVAATDSPECKRLRTETSVGPSCSCHTGVCVLEINAVPVPDVAADTETVREFIDQMEHGEGIWGTDRIREAVGRLAVLAAAAETAQPGRDREYHLNIDPKTAAAELCRANIELHAINAQVVRRADAAEARAVAAEAALGKAKHLLIEVMDEEHIAPDRPLGVVINEFLARAAGRGENA